MILRNSIRCPDGTEIVSRHVHDYVTHAQKDGRIYAVDGGNNYLRRVCVDKDWEDTSILGLIDHEVDRGIFTWTSFGVNGDEPPNTQLLEDMDTDHIKAILKSQVHLARTDIEKLFENELKWRDNHD